MKNLKKLPTKQLEKFSNIFTQLGLVLVLFIVYVTLEHQTEDKTVAVLSASETPAVFYEPEPNVVYQKEVKTPPKQILQKTQQFIPDEVVKGNNDVIETVIDLPVTDPVIIDIGSVVAEKEGEAIGPETVPFINIENAPVFKGCEGLSKKDNKICFDKKMKQFVRRNFDTGIGNKLGLREGVHKIQTQFLIDDKGNVVDIKIRASHKLLEKETQELIEMLPKFTPGMQRNKPVKVRYTLPIAFRVD